MLNTFKCNLKVVLVFIKICMNKINLWTHKQSVISWFNFVKYFVFFIIYDIILIVRRVWKTT